jgi:hypothetical protein
MRTPAQIEASRRNGSLSRGPVTSEGKARSAQNGTTHGLAGSKTIVLEGEDEQKWQALLQSCICQFQPANDLEDELVEEIAAARWRIRRSRAVETAMINMELEKQRKHVDTAFEQPDYSLRHASAIQGLGLNLNLIDRYDVRVRRNFDRAVKNFYDLRARRAENTFLPTEPEDPSGPVASGATDKV